MVTGTTFKLTFEEEYFKQNDTLVMSNINVVLTSGVKKVYGEWYHKIINKITLGYFCNLSYIYNVEIL